MALAVGLLLRALRELYGQQVYPIAGLVAVSSRMASHYRGDDVCDGSVQSSRLIDV